MLAAELKLVSLFIENESGFERTLSHTESFGLHCVFMKGSSVKVV